MTIKHFQIYLMDNWWPLSVPIQYVPITIQQSPESTVHSCTYASKTHTDVHVLQIRWIEGLKKELRMLG